MNLMMRLDWRAFVRVQLHMPWKVDMNMIMNVSMMTVPLAMMTMHITIKTLGDPMGLKHISGIAGSTGNPLDHFANILFHLCSGVSAFSAMPQRDPLGPINTWAC